MANKKTRPARRASGGGEAHERRQARLEARRAARAQELEARRKAERRARLLRFALLGVGVAASVLLLFELFAPPDTPDSIRGHAIRTLGESGAGEHSTTPVDYDSSPPTHGAHDPQPAPCGVHPEPIANEAQVHSLEHGAVGIQYQPDLDPSDIRRIERIARSYDSGVFSAPYPDMEPAIAVTSWGELMELETLDVAAIEDYIAEFRGRGPEDVTCDNLVDEPFEPPGENRS